MTVKQLPGLYSPDHSRYGTITDGSGNLVSISVSERGSGKQLSGFRAPDGSGYMCLTDGDGNLISATIENQFLLLSNGSDFLLLANGVDKLVLIGQGPTPPTASPGGYYFYLGF